MSVLAALTEAGRQVLAHRVTSMMIVFLSAVICAVTTLTAGGTAAAEARVLGRLEAAGSRLLVVTDERDAGLVTPAVVTALNETDVVERAVGVGHPRDVTNAAVPGGRPVPAWIVAGGVDRAVTLTAGRWPRPGEGLVSAAGRGTLGMTEAAGAVLDSDGREYPVVGEYVTAAPFEAMNAGVVIAHDPSVTVGVREVRVIVSSVAAARLAERLVIAVLAPPELTAIRVESPVGVADLQRAVGGDLGGYGRQIVFVTMGGGALLMALIVFADVLLRRRDLGRRRALGASRGVLIGLVLARTAIPALPGSALGLFAGGLAAAGWSQPPPWDFTVGTGVLTLLAAVVAAVPPALTAAFRDPVAVLRTP